MSKFNHLMLGRLVMRKTKPAVNDGPEKPLPAVYVPLDTWKPAKTANYKKPPLSPTRPVDHEPPRRYDNPEDVPRCAVMVRLTKAESDEMVKRCGDEGLPRTAYVRRLIQLDQEYDRPMYQPGAVKVSKRQD